MNTQATEQDIRKAAATIRGAVKTIGATPTERSTAPAVRDLAEWYKKHFAIEFTPAQKDAITRRVQETAD